MSTKPKPEAPGGKSKPRRPAPSAKPSKGRPVARRFDVAAHNAALADELRAMAVAHVQRAAADLRSAAGFAGEGSPLANAADVAEALWLALRARDAQPSDLDAADTAERSGPRALRAADVLSAAEKTVRPFLTRVDDEDRLRVGSPPRPARKGQERAAAMRKLLTEAEHARAVLASVHSSPQRIESALSALCAAGARVVGSISSDARGERCMLARVRVHRDRSERWPDAETLARWALEAAGVNGKHAANWLAGSV